GDGEGQEGSRVDTLGDVEATGLSVDSRYLVPEGHGRDVSHRRCCRDLTVMVPVRRRRRRRAHKRPSGGNRLDRPAAFTLLTHLHFHDAPVGEALGGAVGHWPPHLRSWSMRRDLMRVADEPGRACNAELRAELHMPHGKPITAASMPRWLHQAAAARPSSRAAFCPMALSARATTYGYRVTVRDRAAGQEHAGTVHGALF